MKTITIMLNGKITSPEGDITDVELDLAVPSEVVAMTLLMLSGRQSSIPSGITVKETIRRLFGLS